MLEILLEYQEKLFWCRCLSRQISTEYKLDIISKHLSLERKLVRGFSSSLSMSRINTQLKSPPINRQSQLRSRNFWRSSSTIQGRQDYIETSKKTYFWLMTDSMIIRRPILQAGVLWTIPLSFGWKKCGHPIHFSSTFHCGGLY